MSRHVHDEARVLLRHPWGWIACGFGSGLSPFASGTTGSVAAVLLYWLGGAVACTVYLDFTFVQFFDRLRDTVGAWHFYTGMIKAPVFGIVIAVIGCFEGLQVRGSAESVGQLTTKAVVESIFCVIVLDAVFSIIFLLAGV